MVEADCYLKLLPASIIYKLVEHIDMLSIAVYSSSHTQFYPTYLAQILGLWFTCGVEMMPLCHG